MWSRRLKRRPLAALQVEVTSRCTRQCAICPRTALASVWQDGDISDSTWDRLREDLSLARHVHLQGWGEPLLHPRLPEMVDAAKAAGCAVGITSNGDRLESAIEWIVAKGLDLVTVSVAGDEATHAELRSGAELKALWDVVAKLVASRTDSKSPKVQVSYLLTKKNCEQVPGLIEAAAAAGADELFAIHLDCTPSREIRDAAAFDPSGLHPEAAAAIEAAFRVARSSGIAFRAPALGLRELLVCASDPLSVVFVGWDGRVGPCVNLMLPIEGPIPRWGSGGPTRVEPVVFGHLAEKSLKQILGGECYQSFVEPFEARLAIEREFLEGVATHSGTERLSYLEEGDRRREALLAANAFPASCAGCHKVAGW